MKEEIVNKILVEKILSDFISKAVPGGFEASPSLFIALLELYSIYDGKYSKSEIHWAITMMAKNGEKGIQSFEDRLEERRNISKHRFWKIFIPLKNYIPKRKIKFLSNEYLIVNGNSFKKEFQGTKFQEIVFGKIERSIEFNIEEKQCIICPSNGYSLNEAIFNLRKDLQVLRGVVDYSIYRENWWYNLGGRKMTYIPLQNQCYAIQGNNYLIGNFDKGITISENKFTPDKKKYLDKLISLLEENPDENSLNSLIRDSLRLYSNCMDSTTVKEKFLSLWQIAENITLSGEMGGNTSIVVKRISWHLENLQKLYFGHSYKHSLNSLKSFRNNLVHKGISEIEHDDANFLNQICDIALHWLIKNPLKLKTIQHLRDFYTMRTQSVADLKGKGYVAKQILKVYRNK